MRIPARRYPFIRNGFRSGKILDYPFSTDGCSLFPDGDWGGCCVEHDMKYWEGGSAAAKLEADLDLMECVAHKGYPIIAAIMFIGVRFGGLPFWPVPWRWGYGWKYGRGNSYSKQEKLLSLS